MPLKAGKSQATVAANIREMHKSDQYKKVKASHGKEVADQMAIAAAMQKRREGMHSLYPVKPGSPEAANILTMNNFRPQYRRTIIRRITRPR